ncbi:hypothetical protein DMA15_03680 [Streptomyces sp. WAC 01529]|uniref:hypothetical protein n=1 Tax=Streptomyces sp. WAC 01529 TaxID=2203205 RepID=UPI000F705EDC|nr:hypothetical protein [Streptomyces sp. WAC 01529]AZM51794.1 hypothetical protein DMA15_03680 [Streptomyces sp. WAC 01529]
MSARHRFQERIYDSLVSFNKAAHWDVLRRAQARQHLAEHLASDLGAASAAFVRAAKVREPVDGAERYLNAVLEDVALRIEGGRG